MAKRTTVADLESRFNEIQKSNAELLAAVQASNEALLALAKNGQSAPATTGNPTPIPQPRGDQPLVSTAFVRQGSALSKLISKANALGVGGECRYSRGLGHGMNQALMRSSYKSKGFDASTRIMPYVRKTSRSGKTVADGRALNVHTPKWGASDNRLVLTRTS